MIAVVCGIVNVDASLVTTPENLEKHLWMLAENETILYCIRASDWDEIMQVYYDNQGWGKYKVI